MAETQWPQRLIVVRHGQSAGNAAFDAAHATHRLRVELETRDADVPLSATGRQQAEALGKWFKSLPRDEQPQIMLVSPFVRAVETARVLEAHAALDLDCPVVIDERLREKEFGLFDGLTAEGVKKEYPQEAALRARVGKFYYRPPGGESWCDVVLRLRSAMDSISLHYRGRNVLIVGHEVIVLCLRYLLENLDEKHVLDIDNAGDVANCSVTEFVLRGKKLELARYNFVPPNLQFDTQVTAEPRKNKAGA